MQRSVYNFGQILSDRIGQRENNLFCAFRAAEKSAALFISTGGAAYPAQLWYFNAPSVSISRSDFL
jgi:hypothetical protein